SSPIVEFLCIRTSLQNISVRVTFVGNRISFDRCIFFLHHVIRQGKRHNAAPHAYKSLR
ncbi:Bacterial mobilisation domain-containing protein, partial [Dysosmobacter welbionis]